MSADRLRLLGVYGGGNVDPEPVEMMEDDDDSSTSNDSEMDEMKSENSETTKQDSNGVNDILFNSSIPAKTIFNDANNNNTSILNSNGHAENIDKSKIANYPDEELSEEEQERKRFQIELEFVQSLANPNYLNFLAQRGYFRNPTFLNYLKYLSYWKRPEYSKYIMYPQCLSLLELLQHETFQKEIVNAQCSKYIDEQLLLIWLHYKKRRDWLRVDPVKIPDGIEKLFSSVEESIIKNTKKIVDNCVRDEESVLLDNDTFGAQAFLDNEKL